MDAVGRRRRRHDKTSDGSVIIHERSLADGNTMAARAAVCARVYATGRP